MDELKDMGLPEGYELTDGEVDNTVYLCCKYTVSWQMRAADLAAVTILARSEGPLSGPDCVHRLVKAACDYVWDHIAGEPDETSPEALYEHMAPIVKEWFSKTDQAARSSVS